MSACFVKYASKAANGGSESATCFISNLFYNCVCLCRHVYVYVDQAYCVDLHFTEIVCLHLPSAELKAGMSPHLPKMSILLLPSLQTPAGDAKDLSQHYLGARQALAQLTSHSHYLSSSLFGSMKKSDFKSSRVVLGTLVSVCPACRVHFFSFCFQVKLFALFPLPPLSG